MAKNGVGVKRRRRRVNPREEDTDESDEEYKVTDDDEEFVESDECFSFDNDESEAEFEVSKRVLKLRNTRRSSSSRKRNETIKPRKKRRIVYKDDYDDNDVHGDDDIDNDVHGDDDDNNDVHGDDDEDDAYLMSLGRNANQIKKPAEKKMDFYTEVDNNDNDYVDDDDDDDDDDDEVSDDRDEGLTSLGIPKFTENEDVSYTEEDDDDDDDDKEEDDDAEFVRRDRNRKCRTNRLKIKRVMYTEDENDDDDTERKRNRRKNFHEKKRVMYEEDDDHDHDHEHDDEEEEDDDAEFVPRGRNSKYRKNRQENKRVIYTEDETDDYDTERKRNRRKYSHEKKRVICKEDDDDDDDHHHHDDEEDDEVEYMHSGWKVNQKKNLREKRKVSYTEDGEDDLEEGPTKKTDVSFKDDNEEDEDQNDAEFIISESEFLADEDDSEFMSTCGTRNQIDEPRQKTVVSYKEDNQEEDEDEKDAEFKLSETDFDDDDEDETPKTKKSVKKSKHSKQRNRRFRKKLDKNHIEKRKKNAFKRRKQSVVAESDSDFASSASFNHEYTISEDEREQMREASIYCENFRANLRAKLRSSSNVNQEQRKYPIRKGKEKVEQVKDETSKHVCGICLSEEAKRTVRGVLNCCQHYFCFSCIMEWSKVESRCPLCKQRFATITKSAKSDTGFDLKTVVIPVAECDQVYLPSEEELRGYLDPYGNVTCIECYNGGDEALMLLCDICDSSAHTFCVGLGREVPEGNWYCEGCRPTVFGTLNSQQLTPTFDPIAGGFDLNEMYIPETPLTQQTRVVNEPITTPNGNVATTLRDRRMNHQRHHHHHHHHHRLLNIARPNGTLPSSSSGVRLFGSQLDQTRGSTPQD